MKRETEKPSDVDEAAAPRAQVRREATIASLRQILAFELRKLMGRRLPWITLIAVALTIWLARWAELEGDPDLPGFTLLARCLERGSLVAALFLIIMGSLAVNEEVASGALRAVLLRPIGRGRLIAAKLMALAGFAALLQISSIALAWWLCAERFGPAMIEFDGFLEPVVTRSESELSDIARTLCVATLLPVIAFPVIGALISVLLDSAGGAVACAALLFLAEEALAGTFEEQADWFLPTYFERPLGLLAELGRGIDSRADLLQEFGWVSPHTIVPLAILLGAGLLSALSFRFKEISC